MKKTLIALAAGTLMSVAGFASAAEPMQLTENQMDAVAAGTGGGTITVVSEAGGTASARNGFASSYSETSASVNGVRTSASSSNFAYGKRARASSSAGSLIQISF